MGLSLAEFILFTFFLSLNSTPVQINDEFYSLNSKSNTIYLGIDNAIYIPEKYRNKPEYVFATDNGFLSIDTGIINIIPRRLPDLHIYVYRLNGTDSVLVLKERYFTNYIPRPCVTLANKCITNYEKIDRKFFIENPKLGIFVSDDISGANNWIKINRLTLGFVFSSVYKSYETNGDTLSEEMKKVLMYVKPGQQIDIKVSIETLGEMMMYLPVYKLVIY